MPHSLDRSPNGHARDATVRVRVRSTAVDAIDGRAGAENGGNRSAWSRRALLYALNYMPPGWNG